MTDIVERLHDIGEAEMYEAPSTTKATIEEAADTITALRARVAELEVALTDMVQSSTSKPVGFGDGGTFMITAPSVEALLSARAALQGDKE